MYAERNVHPIAFDIISYDTGRRHKSIYIKASRNKIREEIRILH